MRELEVQLPDGRHELPGSVADFDTAAETINMDDYVVSIVDENGKRHWARGKRK